MLAKLSRNFHSSSSSANSISFATMAELPLGNVAVVTLRTNLPTEDRKAAYHMLLGMSSEGVLDRGAISTVAQLFSVHRSTISRLWTTVRRKALSNHNKPEDEKENIYATDASKRKKGKYKHDRDELKAAVKALPRSKRKKYRWLAAALDIPLSTVHYLTKHQMLFRKPRAPLKPTLTVANKVWRIDHCISKIDPATINDPNPKFVNMYNEVHIDEKWFFLCRDGESYILVTDEEEPPERYVKHKSHIEKVMFLCAQARPRFLGAGGGRRREQRYWDGKIGIWPIGRMIPAQRGSCNRPAGTLEWHNENIDQEVYRALLLNEVVLAIIDKWLEEEYNDPNYTIIIQQDGATSHIVPEDEPFRATMEEIGVPEGKIELYTQPANSPDLNLNDLGFFNSLQSAYYQSCPSNAIELIEMVRESYEDYPSNKINRIWLTLQSCMNEIIKSNGGNQYKIPHMGKEKLEKENRLPVVLEVCPEAVPYL